MTVQFKWCALRRAGLFCRNEGRVYIQASTKEPGVSAKEFYITGNEPYISAKEPWCVAV